ncbi:unnamed protein product [Candidula unifasciata]|uniref:Phospholipase A2 n=1 Tax=Candidula unifasciata TaxID=100452 RepID=A0A8S3YLW4_9EUPU|nr:unnamed protein product [Candidula unifasciata]
MAPARTQHIANFGKGLMFLLSVASIICLVTTTTSAESLGLPFYRLKRHFGQLCSMVNKHTGRQCGLYLSYGCYCGPGTTSTGKPVDETDECCRQHDACYGNTGSACSPKFVTYKYDCQNGNCTCTDSSKDKTCAYKSCLCDLQFGQCLKNKPYNSTYYWMDKSRCNSSETGKND